MCQPPPEEQSRSVASWFVAFATGTSSWKPADKSEMNNLPVPPLPVLLLRGLTGTGGAAAASPPPSPRPRSAGSEVAAASQIAAHCSGCMEHSEPPLGRLI